MDTHVWWWYLDGSERLPSALRKAIDSASGEVWLSPISIWELGLLHERKRVRLAGGIREWAEEAHRAFPTNEAPLNREVAIRSREITLRDRDPADHFLAATALVYELTLMTVDERLIAEAWLPTRSA